MSVKRYGNIDGDLAKWNERMYGKHATPYSGLAGVIERARVRAVLAMAALNADAAVIEIGCERGTLLAALPPCRRIVGVDISAAALADAAHLFADSTRCAEFLQADAQQALPFESGVFDVIICSEMLEHVPNPRAVIENIHASADERTRVVISVPMEGPKILIKKILKATGLIRVLFRGIETQQSEWHLHAFSKRRLLEMLAGLFEVESQRNVLGVHYVVALSKKGK